MASVGIRRTTDDDLSANVHNLVYELSLTWPVDFDQLLHEVTLSILDHCPPCYTEIPIEPYTRSLATFIHL